MDDKKTVTLFIQCLVDSIYPEVGNAMVEVFRKLGIPVTCPTEHTCCGQVAFNSGYRKAARVAARKFVSLFEGAEIIVCPSGSCAYMVKHHYLDLFRNDEKWLQRARRVGAKTFELTEFLVDVLGIESVGANFNGKVTYHDSCHLLRGLGVREQPRKLLRNIKGLQFVEMKNSDRCCGFGGAFSIKYPEISVAILDEKVETILATGADIVTGCDIGCLMNIQGRLSRKRSSVKTLHIAQLLAGP